MRRISNEEDIRWDLCVIFEFNVDKKALQLKFRVDTSSKLLH